MLLSATHELVEVTGGVDIFSISGIFILTTGILFTVGVPLTMILRGKKD